MDRLIFKQIDFEFQAKILGGWRWKPLTQGPGRQQAEGARPADEYRGARRNARARHERSAPSVGRGYRGPIPLNRSAKWRFAENYHDARDLSPSSRDVV
jgi:hypothetical protein